MKLFKHIGAEAILSVMLLPFVVWIITSIYDLKSAYATVETKSQISINDVQEIKEDVKFIRNYLLEQKNGK